MASGMDWALQSVLAYLGLEPEATKASLANTVQIVLGAKAQLDRIEANQRLILQALGKDIPDGNANGLAIEHHHENGAGHDTGGA